MSNEQLLAFLKSILKNVSTGNNFLIEKLEKDGIDTNLYLRCIIESEAIIQTVIADLDPIKKQYIYDLKKKRNDMKQKINP
jgi:hypothetical protein